MMTTPPSSCSSAQSPVSRVPYDVLREIFIHCLPRRRFREQQPDTTIAPMLLCQICSAWRTVALNSATLWSHLSYVFLITDNGSNDSWKTSKEDLAFLSWWRRNQGTMAPSLCIKVISIGWYEMSKNPILDSKLEAVDMMSLVKYIASARYLEAREDIWHLVHKWSNQEVYPNLHTLVISRSETAEEEEVFYRSRSLMPNHTPSALRFLSLSHIILSSGSNFVTVMAWSKLTRISLNSVTISLNAWLSVIRSVPDLEWGYFDIISYDQEHAQYPKCTLPRLSKLHISQQLDGEDPTFEFPLSMLLANVHLPALHTLSLSSFEDSWSDSRVISDLYRVLNSTPAITTLILGNSFLSLGNKFRFIHSAIGNVKPVWRLATHLVHLHFEFACASSAKEEKHKRQNIIDNIFHSDNHWLDLNNPACTIQKITMIHYGFKRSWLKSCTDFTMSRVEEHLKKAPYVNVTFEIQVWDKERTAAGEWNEWGPNL
ncbi:hypothetical protein BJ912DRAFT_527215 [Pholiota molesta]|nr:hypothetical protein BJ912DRAFT_527215 [Pholiota molesta]